MLGFQDYYNMRIENLKDFVTVIFVLVDDLYNEHIPEEIKNRLHKDTAILSDSEIITIAISRELLTIDSESAWHSFVQKNMKDLFPKTCERSRFNRTKRNLLLVIDEIRKQLNQYVKVFASNERIIDSFRYLFASLAEHIFARHSRVMKPIMENVLQKKKFILDTKYMCYAQKKGISQIL